MLRERFHENGDLLFGQVVLDKGEEMLFDLVAVLVLNFEERQVFYVIFLKIIDDGLFAIE
jgi:hypothetical protein